MVLGATIAACVTVNLSSTSQATIVLDYTSHDFGQVNVGGSAAWSFTITTQGDFDADIIDQISPGQGCTGFSVNPKNLPAQVTCTGSAGSGGSQFCTSYTFEVVFAPQGQGQYACPITITYHSMNGSAAYVPPPVMIPVMGFGVAQQYAMDVVPTTTIHFGDVLVSNLSDGQMIRITNAGSGALSVTPSQTPPSGSVFVLSGCAVGSAFQLAPGATKDCSVFCQPASATMYTGAVTFSANNGIMRSVSYDCNGIASDLHVTPSPVVFDNSLVGTAPGNKTVVIQNQGSAATTIQEIELNSMVGAELEFVTTPTTPMSLPASGSGSFSLKYTAATEHPSGQLGTLVIRENNGNVRNVIVTGEALVGEIGTAPATVDFGPICPGTTANQEVQVYAAAAGKLTLASVSKPDAPFDVTTVMNQPLAGNHGSSVSLTASVTGQGEGVISDRFVLSSNAPGDMQHQVPMSAIVLPSGVSPTPTVVHFGPGVVDAATIGREVTISNCGATELVLSGARFDGPNGEGSPTGPEFFLATQPEGEIAPGGSRKFLVVMFPKSEGIKSATLTFEHSAGTTVVALDGTGFGANGGRTDLTTYYACNTGGAAGGSLPIGLSLLALMRPRRRRKPA